MRRLEAGISGRTRVLKYRTSNPSSGSGHNSPSTRGLRGSTTEQRHHDFHAAFLSFSSAGAVHARTILASPLSSFPVTLRGSRLLGEARFAAGLFPTLPGPNGR
jgi:hypothetical protein